MPKFRKNPIVIEAFCWLKNGDHPEDGPAETEGKVVRYFRHPQVAADKCCPHCLNAMNDHGFMDTHEGGYTVCPGDWIITGVKGERYPCKPDIFRATYEEVK
jgi:hypothetical protein